MPIPASRFVRSLMVGLTVAAAVTAIGSSSAAAGAVPGTPATGRHMALAWAPAGPIPMPTIGRPAPEKSPEAPITLNSLHRDKLGLVSLTWTLTNNDQSNSMDDPPSEMMNPYDYSGAKASAITLIDESAKIRYKPLRMDPGKTCICTNRSGIPYTLDNGQSAIFYEVYKLPTNVNSVTVNIPNYSPAKDIAIH